MRPIIPKLLNYCQEYFRYSKGKLYWKKKPSRRVNVGDEAGSINNGRRRIKLNDKQHYSYRLIFLMHHGYLPEFIDHKDGDRLNDKIGNLRPATRSQNGHNAKRHKNNTSGIKGLTVWEPGRITYWKGQVMVGGKKHIKTFPHSDAGKVLAEKWLKKTRKELHKEFARDF